MISEEPFPLDAIFHEEDGLRVSLIFMLRDWEFLLSLTEDLKSTRN